MAFTLNTGEFDLGAGFIGRGTILVGEAYAVGTATTGVQGVLNTSGLEGISYSYAKTYQSYTAIQFRASDDLLTGTISAASEDTGGNTATSWSGRSNPTVNPNTGLLSNFARFYLGIRIRSDSYTSTPNSSWLSHLNTSTSTTKNLCSGATGSQVYEFYNSISLFLFDQPNWRYLVRDHATSLVHYPSTLEEGSVFAASCVNSPTQWGLWIAGEVGDRSGYFNQTQGYFSIIILRDGSTWYISAFTPAAADSISRNDNVIRSPNIVPAPGQTGADRFSEFFIARDLGNGFSETIGKIPGFIYVDMNQAANSALTVGSLLKITPGVGTTYDLTNHGAIVVAQWGLNISATVSNVGSIFTVDTASTPSSASLSSLNRTRTTLEENQRIQITATPPTGLSTATNYWVKNWDPTAFTFELSATEGGATIVPSSNTNSTITRYAGLIAMPCYQA